jgi:hypothetical protein
VRPQEIGRGSQAEGTDYQQANRDQIATVTQRLDAAHERECPRQDQ